MGEPGFSVNDVEIVWLQLMTGPSVAHSALTIAKKRERFRPNKNVSESVLKILDLSLYSVLSTYI